LLIYLGRCPEGLLFIAAYGRSPAVLANNKMGTYRATLGVVNRQAVAEEFGRIRAPMLVVVGDQDVATVPAKAEPIQERIANTRLVVIPGAGHSSTKSLRKMRAGETSAWRQGLTGPCSKVCRVRQVRADAP
jgi:pimeloyl-ACP methyl ester carboxylesterase